MSQNHALIAEINMEAANTRKMLERVPIEKNDWKPHRKSRSLGRLATHVAEIPGWITATMTRDEFDLATSDDLKERIASSKEELFEIFDKNVNEAIEALENAKDEDFDKMWTLRNGEEIYFTLPKKVVLRTYALSHNYHHRAQLGVYLRLLDIPIPGMYGPSADEMPVAVTETTTAEALAN